MSTTTEPIEVHTVPSVADSLRRLADWIEENQVPSNRVVSCCVDGYGTMKAHLAKEIVIRLLGDNIALSRSNEFIHGRGVKDGVQVVFCF